MALQASASLGDQCTLLRAFYPLGAPARGGVPCSLVLAIKPKDKKQVEREGWSASSRPALFYFFTKTGIVASMPVKIVREGDPVLREIAKPVFKKDISSRAIQGLVRRMSELLKKEQFGVALAAPQVGVSLRLFVIAGKIFGPEKENRTFINPEITRRSRKKLELPEGCLSVRGKYGTVERHEKTSIKAYDEKGRMSVHHASGLIAQIFQHEIDHLEGILYTDKAVELHDEPKKK